MVADTHPEQPALTPGSSRKTAQQPPPQAVMGLLNYITETSLDEDYAQVSEQRRRSGEVTPRRRPGTVGMAVLAVFGVLVATAAVQTSRNADQSASSRASLVSQVNARADVLDRQRTTAQELQREITALGDAQLAATTEGRSLESRLNRLGVLTGATAARGPGVRVVVDDAPGAKSPKFMVQAPDLQKLANGLWTVGAEAIAVNGQRLTSLSAIRDAGSAITVNYVSLRPPYTVSAIGNPKRMGADLLDTSGGQTWATLQSFGLKFDVNTEDNMLLPAAKRVAFRYAHEPERRP
jgi:uncharacterized protein YlxW (UPF0749 family)